MRAAIEHWGDGQTLALLGPSADTGRDRIGLGIVERSAASPQMVRLLLESNLTGTDVKALLPSVRVPTLVLHRQDEFIPVEGAHYLAEHIPGAKLVVLAGADHIPYFGDGQGYAEEIEEFLTGARHAPASDRVLTTVMFTDVVGSTERAAALGDARWRELMASHDDLVRTELERHGGCEVKTMGDGFLATFDGPARGIRCACAIGEAVRPLEIKVRAGLHTGECDLVGDDISGMAVNIGARIATLAGPDEVLVSSTVKDLVVGSGIAFTDRGNHHLKGVQDAWHLFIVGAVEAPASNQLIPDARERRPSDRMAVRVARRSPRLAQRLMSWRADA
jgi:class 3 adenylate cyclase